MKKEILFESLTHTFFADGTSVAKIKYAKRKVNIISNNNMNIAKVNFQSGNGLNVTFVENVTSDVYEF